MGHRAPPPPSTGREEREKAKGRVRPFSFSSFLYANRGDGGGRRLCIPQALGGTGSHLSISSHLPPCRNPSQRVRNGGGGQGAAFCLPPHNNRDSPSPVGGGGGHRDTATHPMLCTAGQRAVLCRWRGSQHTGGEEEEGENLVGGCQCHGQELLPMEGNGLCAPPPMPTPSRGSAHRWACTSGSGFGTGRRGAEVGMLRPRAAALR